MSSLNLSDRETVAQIQENPYLQYFVGLSGYQMEQPFAPSLLVVIRKRMGQSLFEQFHQSIVNAVDANKREGSPKAASSANSREGDDDDNGKPQGGGDSESKQEPPDQRKHPMIDPIAPQISPCQ
ncbi:MAG: transposase [gamma proteobacterium symbiont of Phacoides pectinatus]